VHQPVLRVPRTAVIPAPNAKIVSSSLAAM